MSSIGFLQVIGMKILGVHNTGFWLGCLTATIFFKSYESKREEYEELRRTSGDERKTPSNTVAAE